MVKYGIQYDFYSLSMRLFNQFPKDILITEIGINLEVIDDIIFMVGGGYKNRCQVNPVDT